MYSKTDGADFTAQFGRGLRSTEGTQSAIVNVLLGSTWPVRIGVQRHIEYDAELSVRTGKHLAG
jgi:hypothetical protein